MNAGIPREDSSETLYEETDQFETPTPTSASPVRFPAIVEEEEEDEEQPQTYHSDETLAARVQKRAEETGQIANAIIYVMSECYHVHKEVISKCDYLRRQLQNSSVATVSPPFINITPETFIIVAEFCYGAKIIGTPFNMVALHTAAKQLEIANLFKSAENYFLGVVSFNQEYAMIALNSCLPLMPKSETVSALVSRCLHALVGLRGRECVEECMDVLKLMTFEHFQIVMDSVAKLFSTIHNVLYFFVDSYIKENEGKLTEEQRTQLCSNIDCVKLTPPIMIDAVQNSRMSMRFVVRCMFADQFHTRNFLIASTSLPSHPLDSPEPQNPPQLDQNMTLGDILQQDAAIRHVSQIRQNVLETSSKIETLEKELTRMKVLLTTLEETRRAETANNRVQETRDLTLSRIDGTRAVSMRVLGTVASANRVERGERGSVSSASLRFSGAGDGQHPEMAGSRDEKQIGDKRFGRKFLNALKSVFRASGSSGTKQEKEATGCRVGRKIHLSPK